MPAAKPNVFTIPASAPFLRVLIDALRDGKLVPGFPSGGDPLELSKATLYLPTRRACRLAREVFLDELKGDAAILPRIVALGDLDEDEIAFAEAATGELAEAALSLPEAFDALERRLTLAELISKWAAAITPDQGAPLIANTPEAAIALADALARLMDDMITRQVPWDNLDRLVPEDLDEYWKQSLEFLKFMYPRWRAILAERNAIESAERRDKLIEAEAKRLENSDAPVIAAGSTGSMPATAKLLATIAKLPHGAVVLPGLDMNLDDASWALIAGDADDTTHDGAPAAGHAQFAMHALLDRIGITRGDVRQLAPPQPHGRERLVSEALRPAATTEHWPARTGTKDFAAATDGALASLAVIEAANAEDEALAIAVALRETLETAGKSAALVTPDRALARRVAAALERWQVKVDDSRRRFTRRHIGRRVREACGASRPRRPGAGDVAGAAQASAAAPRRQSGRAPCRHRDSGTRAAARPASAPGQRRAWPSAFHLPRQSRRAASQRSARADRRRQIRRRRRTDRPARRRVGAAGKVEAGRASARRAGQVP